MKSEDFDKCRMFLEEQIKNNQDNVELLNVYLRLIELKSEYDRETDKAWIEKEIRNAEFNSKYNTAVHTNNTELNKTVHTNNMSQGMNWDQQQAENYRNDQNQMHNTVQSAFNNNLVPPIKW